MIKLDVNSKYVNHLIQGDYENICIELKKDLHEKVEEIFKRLQNSPPLTAGVHLQTSRPNLRRSVEMVHTSNQPFFQNEGQCKGATFWSIALFEAIKKTHPEVPAGIILTEIAKEFSEGVGIHAATLQMCFENDKDSQILQSLNMSLKEVTHVDPKGTNTELMKEISKLGDGSFVLRFPGVNVILPSHERSYKAYGHEVPIFIEKDNYFFLDINTGLHGTGKEVGTKNKLKDNFDLLTIANIYYPFQRARDCFEKGLEEIVKTFPKEKAERISIHAYIFKASLPKDGVGLERTWLEKIIHQLEYKIDPFSDAERKQLFHLLCERPELTLQTLQKLGAPILFKHHFVE